MLTSAAMLHKAPAPLARGAAAPAQSELTDYDGNQPSS